MSCERSRLTLRDLLPILAVRDFLLTVVPHGHRDDADAFYRATEKMTDEQWEQLREHVIAIHDVAAAIDAVELI